MATHPTAPVLAENAIVIGPIGTDAGYLKIVSDGHGGFKIVRVPGWNPEGMHELGAALKAVAAALAIKDPHASSTVLNAAANLAHAEIGRAIGAQAAGHTTVVVLG